MPVRWGHRISIGTTATDSPMQCATVSIAVYTAVVVVVFVIKAVAFRIYVAQHYKMRTDKVEVTAMK
jgi:hypothetical protein